MITGYHKEKPVIAYFIGESRIFRHRILPTNTINLNTTGNSYFDKLTIEYNNFLIKADQAVDIDSVFEFINTLKWDEFYLPGLAGNFYSNYETIINSSKKFFHTIYDEVTDAHFVDLNLVRNSGKDYLDFLSSNKRYQIRRSIKQYEKDGRIQITQAKDIHEALFMLDRLAELHQATWGKRGQGGAFSSTYFYQFHKELIKKCIITNQVQLLHIYNDKSTIGYIYNFVDNRRVLFYQSGLHYRRPNVYRPGLICHYYTILHNNALNMDAYDFLAGNSPYKISLGTSSNKVYWIRLTKSPIRFALEQGIRRVKRAQNRLLSKF